MKQAGLAVASLPSYARALAAADAATVAALAGPLRDDADAAVRAACASALSR